MRIAGTILLGSLLHGALTAQPVVPDLSFNGNGSLFYSIPAKAVFGHSVYLRPDGRMVITGGVEKYWWQSYPAIWSFLEDGSPDLTFGVNGVAMDTTTWFGKWIAPGLLQPDGKTMVAGTAYVDVQPVFKVLRFTESGLLDTAFGEQGHAQVEVVGQFGAAVLNTIALQTDGSILLGGTAQESTVNELVLARLLPTGNVDTLFGVNGVALLSVDGSMGHRLNTVELQADGRILAAGCWYSALDSIYRPVVARFNTDGSVDTTFGSSGVLTIEVDSSAAEVCALAVQSDGKILMAGKTPLDARVILARCDQNGVLDPDYGDSGISSVLLGGAYSLTADLLVDTMDNAMVCGGFQFAPFEMKSFLLRCDTTGALDPSFGPGGVVVTDTIGVYQTNSMVVQDDGKFVLAGMQISSMQPRKLFALRYLYDGGVEIGERSVDLGTAQLYVFPDPTNGPTTLRYTVDKEECLSLQLHDAAGRVARTFLTKVRRSPGEHHELLELSGLVAGNYVLVLSGAHGSRSIKVVKQ